MQSALSKTRKVHRWISVGVKLRISNLRKLIAVFSLHLIKLFLYFFQFLLCKVFIHDELNQRGDFLPSVDKIMDGLKAKYSDFEINYLKLYVDGRTTDEKDDIFTQSKNKILEIFQLNYSPPTNGKFADQKLSELNSGKKMRNVKCVNSTNKFSIFSLQIDYLRRRQTFLISFLFSSIVCKMGLKEVSLFIDVSTSTAKLRHHKTATSNSKKLKLLNEIPHFHFDYSLESVMKVLQSFLLARNISDIVLIVQDEMMEDEVLTYNLKSQSPLRFIVLSQPIASIAQRLKSIRPIPDLFAIIAESDRMKGIFQDVSLISKFWNMSKSSISHLMNEMW